MDTVLAASDIAKQAVEGAAAIRVDGVVVQKPGVTPFGFAEDGFCLDKLWHGGYVEKITFPLMYSVILSNSRFSLKLPRKANGLLSITGW
tara:strand:- start:37328 stop:37597 length:270 start_codon:yes stop_codon:yes gene_type:complete